eukprot:12917115-Alexandrium_andersonii.AAC.1
MEEAAAPGRPAGRNALAPCSKSVEFCDFEVSALCAGGAAFRAAPQAAHRAASEAVADFRQLQAKDR